ncbi:bifunctional DNA primase/polymerase [Hoeflea poritis]|uniref:Bifunctional DNA primase/polymerase n=1 Tax=Hoeflea poritis TaxID=2993659 RepID=A0ABT4VPS1_9HYPH|nr:bifunctional DNA primase/polymerase [Hoeflea poritis]MDA4846165.1 bifunctional DNA primase/polymerase [Hoeflea poritis]
MADKFLRDVMDNALSLFRRGYVPLPLRHGGKHLDIEAMGYAPLHFKTRRKLLKELAFTSLCFHFSQKPPTEEEVSGWFTGFTGNVGILGGFDGLLVLDFDGSSHFNQWRADHDELVANAPVARSPNGHHVYLKTGTPTVTSSMYAGMRRIGHVKSLGGYVVASPSVLAGRKAYEWIRSPLDAAPPVVDGLRSLGIDAVSPFKRCYDSVRKRGYFEVQ